MPRAITGITALGFANLLFVWLLVQQLGFWLADPRTAILRRRTLALVAVAALATLLVLGLTGVYSLDLYANLNPPTLALVLLGVAQGALFELARTRLRRLAERRALVVVVGAINERAMTIYAWHMLALIALAGVTLASGVALPAPLSGAWWLSRPLWLLLSGVAVGVIVAFAGRIEQRRQPRPSAVIGSRAFIVAAVGAGGILIVLVAGSSLAGWVVGAALVAAAPRIPLRSRPDILVTR